MIGFENIVLHKLNSILKELEVFNSRMILIESRRQKISNEDLNELEDEISLPIKNMVQLDEIEEKLKNRDFLKKMVTCISQLFIFAILNFMLLNLNYKQYI